MTKVNNMLLEIITPLGEGEAHLTNFSAKEVLGVLPSYQLTIITRKPFLEASTLLGKNITIGLQMPQKNAQKRYFNGYITQFSDAGSTVSGFWQGSQSKENNYTYVATLHPWLWFLTRSSNSRIFQKKSVPEIIEEVCQAYPFSKIEKTKLVGKFEAWEFCVQYRESDFNFICRLMEQEGIYYYFKYSDGGNTMVLCNVAGNHGPRKGYEKISYNLGADGNSQDNEVITDWHISHEVKPGRYTISDFDFRSPRSSLLSKAINAKQHDLSNFEIYDYPGEFRTLNKNEQHSKESLNQYSKIRLEELHAYYEVVSGSGSIYGIKPGFVFELIKHPNKVLNKKYLVISASYHITNNVFGSGGSDFNCSFQAIDAETQFRSSRITPKPIVQGPQTAIVVGPEDEEIYTDEYGRIMVQFHWDRYSKANENSSCFVRVSQAWAGKNWGAIFIPRIGQEVIVEFLEGDPDQPIVTGCVYNGDSKPPYVLQDNKTRSGFKTSTYKGGNDNFNELRFEDKQGAEEVYIHAEKDMVSRIKHDQVVFVGNDSHLIVKQDLTEKIEGEQHLSVTGDQNVKVNGSISNNVAQDWQAKAGQKFAVNAGNEIHLKAGSNLILEAGSLLSLKVGGNFITIDSSGIYIKGAMVNINSGGSAGSGSGASPTPPQAPMEAHTSIGGGKSAPPKKPEAPEKYSPQAKALKLASIKGLPFVKLNF